MLIHFHLFFGDGGKWGSWRLGPSPEMAEHETKLWFICSAPPLHPSTTRHAQCYQISSPVCQLRVEFISLSLYWRGWNPIWLSLILHFTHLWRKKKANIQHAGEWGCMEGSNFLLLVPFPSPDYQSVVITNIQSPCFSLRDLRMKTGRFLRQLCLTEMGDRKWN